MICKLPNVFCRLIPLASDLSRDIDIIISFTITALVELVYVLS